MKIILSLLDTPAFGGAEQYLLSHLYELQKRSKTRVVLFTNQPAVKDRVKVDGSKIEVRHLPYRLDAIGNWKGLVKYFVEAPIALVWFLITLRRLSKRTDALIVYTPGFSDRMLFSPFIKLLGHKLIWIEFGPLAPIFKRNWGFPKLLYALGTSFPDKVVTISEHVKRSILNDTQIPENKIQIIYPTTVKISDARLTKLRKAGKLWRKNHKLSQKKLITFVGRLASEKEIILLIKAFTQVIKKFPKTHLAIVGDGPERSVYEQFVKKLGLINQTIFTGFVTELAKQQILATSDVFVFPSAWELEGFGMTTIEAMVLGVPVVTSGAGPQGEIVEDGKTGFYFQPHTAKALVEKISEVLTNPKLVRKVAWVGRQFVIKKFTTLHLGLG